MCASDALRFVAGLLCAGLLSSGCWAQQASREQELIRRLRQQVQQLQQEQAVQQQAAQRAGAEKQQAQAQLEAAQAELRRLRGGSATQARQAAEQAQALEALRGERDALQARADEQRTALEAAAAERRRLRSAAEGLQQALSLREAARGELASRHELQAQGLQTCIANNQALHALGSELLQRWANKGLGEVLAQNEPLLQLKRVALENLLGGYQDKLDALALKPAGGGPLAP